MSLIQRRSASPRRSSLASGRRPGGLVKNCELLSLIGLLSHACEVVRSGRSFLRRLIDLSTIPKHLEHYVRLNLEARSDIEWWAQYSQVWNGMSMMHLPDVAYPGAVLTSDASAYSGPHWFMLPWTGSIVDYHITVKELIPIVVAGAVWGSTWHGSTLLAQCDNMAVVHIVNHGSSNLARCLAFITAKLDFHVVASHIKGAHNIRADALSRDNLSLFHSLHPQAEQEGTPVPQSLLDLLIVSKPDWTSQRWTEQWTTTFITD